MRRGMIAALLTACLLTGLLAGAFAAPDADDPEQIITQFLRAYILKDRDITPYVPEEEKNLFGPYPFAGVIEYGQAKVDKHQALVEFKEAMAEAK